MNLQHQDITEQIIGAAFEVYRVLGYGFLEKVYQKAIQVELRLRGLTAERESKIKVRYKDALVGDYSADLFVEECVLVELKIANTYHPEDEPQLLNELKVTRIKVGMIFNFGKNKVEFKRMVF